MNFSTDVLKKQDSNVGNTKGEVSSNSSECGVVKLAEQKIRSIICGTNMWS